MRMLSYLATVCTVILKELNAPSNYTVPLSIRHFGIKKPFKFKYGFFVLFKHMEMKVENFIIQEIWKTIGF